MEEELLFGLTPAELWAWNYLLFLAEKQGSAHVILPRPGEDLKAEKIFCRKHLKNILKSLKAKRHLTNLIFPRSKARQIEVLLPASKIGELQFLKEEKRYLEFPNNKARGSHSSPIASLGNSSSPIIEVISGTLPENNPLQAKLKDSLKSLLKQKQQGELRVMIGALTEGEAYQHRVAIGSLCPHEPQGRYGWKLKLFVIIRYLQDGSAIEKPQRWMNRVASVERAKFEGRGVSEKSRSSGFVPGGLRQEAGL